jgi:hypothetical protein
MNNKINKTLAEVMGYKWCPAENIYYTADRSDSYHKNGLNFTTSLNQAAMVADKLVDDKEIIGWALHNLGDKHELKYYAQIHSSTEIEVKAKTPEEALSMAVYEFVTETDTK